MSRRTSSVQREFEQSLRSYSRSGSIKPSVPLNQKQDEEFNQIYNILKQHTQTIDTGDFNLFSQNISLLMADKQFPLKKHIAIDIFVPKSKSEIGLKLLQSKEFWIILVIYFELFAKKGQASQKQYRQMIAAMREYIDEKLSEEILDYAYKFCKKGGETVNFLKSPGNHQISEENSNLAQCYSNRGQSLFDDSIHINCPNNSRVQSLLNDLNINDHNIQTVEIKETNQMKNEPIQPFIHYQIDPEQQNEVDQLIKEDQEQHEREREQITQEFSDNSMSQFYSLQHSFNGQRRRKSRSLVGIKAYDEELQQFGSGFQVQQSRQSRSSDKDNSENFSLRRYSRRSKKKQLKDKIMEQQDE